MTKPKANSEKKSPTAKAPERRSLEETGSYETLKTISKEIEPAAPSLLESLHARVAELEAKNAALRAWVQETVKLGQVNYATADAVLKG